MFRPGFRRDAADTAIIAGWGQRGGSRQRTQKQDGAAEEEPGRRADRSNTSGGGPAVPANVAAHLCGAYYCGRWRHYRGGKNFWPPAPIFWVLCSRVALGRVGRYAQRAERERSAAGYGTITRLELTRNRSLSAKERGRSVNEAPPQPLLVLARDLVA